MGDLDECVSAVSDGVSGVVADNLEGGTGARERRADAADMYLDGLGVWPAVGTRPIEVFKDALIGEHLAAPLVE